MGAKKRKRKRGEFKFLLLFLAVIITLSAACGFFYAAGKDGETKDINAETQGKQTVNLSEDAKTCHRTIDNFLLEKRNSWQLKDSGPQSKKEEIVSTGGEVEWTQREVYVGVPVKTALYDAADYLKTRMDKAGYRLIEEKDAKYHKIYKARMLKFGIKVKEGEENIRYFPTDEVYFFHNSNLTGNDGIVKGSAEKTAVAAVVKKSVSKDKTTSSIKGKYSGKMAVVIDDCGYNNKALGELLNTDYPFTYAIIPYKQGSTEALNMIKVAKKTPILHMAMEPNNKAAMSEGANTIMTDMSSRKVRRILEKALDSLPGVEGMNNHQGSKATADKDTMEAVMKVMKKRGLFFLDSRTNSKSVAYDVAKKNGVRTASNMLFLDNTADPDAIFAEIKKGLAMAHKKGYVIVICHSRPATAKAWMKYGKEVGASGVKLVPLKQLLR